MVRILRNILLVSLLVEVVVAAEDITEKVGHIQRTLLEQRIVLDQARGKEIVVLMGNAGSGKSTLANLLAEVPLDIDSSGNIVTRTDDGSKIGPGQHSITKYPTFLQSKAGIVWDCPGFKDTEGAVDDTVAAALTRELLINASAVKVVFVTSAEELGAARGKLFKDLLRTTGMFEEPFLKSCFLVINKVGGGVIDTSNWLQSVLGGKEGDKVEGLERFRDVIPVRKTCVFDDGIEVLFGDRDNLIRAIKSVEGNPVPSVNISLAFGAETADVLVGFFTMLAKNTLAQHKEAIYQNVLGSLPMTSENVSSLQGNCWDMFLTFVAHNQDYQLIRPLAERQKEAAFNSFKETFFREHTSYVQELRLKEYEEAARKGEEEKGRLERLRQESERLAREGTARAEALEKEVASAKEREKKAREEAESIKGTSMQNEHERAEALKRSSEATAAKESLEREAEKQRALSQEAERKLQEANAQILETNSRLQQQAQQFQAEREADRQREQRELQALQAQMRDLTGQLGQVAQLQAQLAQLRAQITQVTPFVLFYNQHTRDIKAVTQDHSMSHELLMARLKESFRSLGLPSSWTSYDSLSWPLIPWPF